MTPKRAARQAVHRALRAGAVRQSCVQCGAFPAEAHHPDYAKPFDVLWPNRQLLGKRPQDPASTVERGRSVRLEI